MKPKWLISLLLLALLPVISIAQEPAIDIKPRHYICYRAGEALKIDGLLDEAAWQKAEWTDYFVDIEGSLKPAPRLKTRAKMLWDDQYLYVAAQLEEPHVWATLTERESVIFYDPDFEVFIDPDGDTFNYAEYEMNALNTQWDLLLLKPYRDDVVHNVALDNWNYNGIHSAVHVNGTINNPNDLDEGWTLEIAFPLDALSELSATGKIPVAGEQYRIDFSRVEWTVDVREGKYVKRTHLIDGKEKPLPENNWVWSPQGVIAMHQPETWGKLQFSSIVVGQGKDEFMETPDNEIVKALRTLYFREIDWKTKTGSYTSNLKDLGLENRMIGKRRFSPDIYITPTFYEAVFRSDDGKRSWHISHDGRSWMNTVKK